MLSAFVIIAALAVVIVVSPAVPMVARWLGRSIRHRGDLGSTFGTVLLVGGLGFGALMFYSVRQVERSVAPSSSSRVISTSAPSDRIRTVTVLDGDSPSVIDARGPSDSIKSFSSTKPSTATAEAEPGVKDITGTDDSPAWTNEPPHRSGDAYVIAVSSGDVSDAMLRDEALDLKLVAAANRYVDEILFKQPGISARLNVSPQELREKFVREQYPSAGQASSSDRLYARLELDADFRAEMEARQRRVISHDRLQLTGGIAAGVLVALAGTLAWLKRKPLAA